MPTLRVFLFYLFFVILFFSNIWGIYYDLRISQFIFYFTPAVLFSTYFFSKERIILPSHLTILVLMFLSTVGLSVLTSVHIQTSFEQQLFYIATFLIVVFVYNNTALIKKYIILFLTILSFLSIQYSILLAAGGQFFKPFIPYHDEQLIYRLDDLSHYPQGIFIFILAVVTYVYLLKKASFVYGATFVLTLFALWLSYLRSAYVGLVGVIILNSKYLLRKQTIVLGIVAGVVSSIIVFFPILTDYRVPFVSDMYSAFIPEHSEFRYKDFANGRWGFLQSAFAAIRERPLTGYGAGNFSEASIRYTLNVDAAVGTSHNIFLDIFAENGIIAGFVFIMVVTLIGLKAFYVIKEKDVDTKVIASLFIGFLIIFQFNYYHLMAFLFMMFLVLGILVYREKKQVSDRFIVPALSGVLFITGVIILAAFYLNSNGSSALALKLYPVYQDAFHNNFREAYREGDRVKLESLISSYTKLYGQSSYNLSYIGDIYIYEKNYDRALEYYQKALFYAPRDAGYVVKVYELIQQADSESQAKAFVASYITKYPILFPGMYFEDRKWFEDWCRENEVTCE